MSEGLAAGQRIGEWTLESPLGRGGMAEVWRATSAARGLRVALKVLGAERAEVPAQTERFLREARTGAALRHPGLVTIHAAGRDDGRLWIAMEPLDGEDLAARVRRGPLAVRSALRVLRAVTEALAFAHARGVLHRDVKGANVFITRDGAVKLLDLGIARAAGDDTMTATGDLLGTLTHLAPELARGERATPLSDLYAVGVTLFEALTGRLPFQGNAVSLVMHHARTAPPRARALAPAVPAEVDALVDALLAKDPAARPPSAASLVTALDARLAEIPDDAPSPASGPLVAALATMERELAAHDAAVAAAEATLARARSVARECLGALQSAGTGWLAEATARASLAAVEARWSQACDGVEAAAALRGARAAHDDVATQVRALRARVAEVGGR